MTLHHRRRMLGVATVLFMASAANALAQTPVTATTDLNVRSGPGPQYPVVSVIGAGEPATLTGCIQNSRWCAVDEGDKAGFVYSDYLAADIGGSRVIITERPAEAGVVYIEPPAEGSIEMLDGSTASIGDELIGRVEDVEVIDPPAAVRTYVVDNRVDPVFLQGEVVVGAGLPETVELRDIPDYGYEYVYVNGQPVLVEPATRRIVYVVR